MKREAASLRLGPSSETFLPGPSRPNLTFFAVWRRVVSFGAGTLSVRMMGLGLGAKGAGCKVQNLVCTVKVLGVRAQDLELRARGRDFKLKGSEMGRVRVLVRVLRLTLQAWGLRAWRRGMGRNL